MRAIKRSFALALCLCLLLGSCGTLAESFSARQIDFCKEYVNLRERPDSKSRSLGQVYIGEVVVAAPYDDAFSYCCYNGQYGYIRSEYLNANIQPWSEGTFYVTNCREYISLRRMPMKSADVLARDLLPRWRRHDRLLRLREIQRAVRLCALGLPGRRMARGRPVTEAR